MAAQPGSPDHDAMAGEVDRLLRQLRSQMEPPPVRSASPTPARPAPGGSPATAPDTRTNARDPAPGPASVWARVALGIVLAGALTQWPYAYCGLHLAGYLAAAGLVGVTGVWAATGSWRRRMALAHVLAIALLFAGAVLAAHQALPRFGYAPAPAAWTCAP